MSGLDCFLKGLSNMEIAYNGLITYYKKQIYVLYLHYMHI